MSRVLTTLILPTLLVTACGAPQATIDQAYGNTLVAALPGGGEVRYHFNADGSYDAIAPDGSPVEGRYTLADGQLCTTSSLGTQQCSRFPDDKSVGDTWTQVRADGQTVTLTLIEGR